MSENQANMLSRQLWRAQASGGLSAIAELFVRYDVSPVSELTYKDRLRRLHLPSLELRRLHVDLVWCYY